MPLSEQEKNTLITNIGSNYSIPMEALPSAVQMQPDVMSGQISGIPVKETDETTLMKYLKEEAPDIGLSVYGGIKGARMGKPLGAAGQLLGGVAGGILGSATGKVAEETPEYRAFIGEDEIPDTEKYSFLSAVGQSGLEELGGRIIGGVASPVVQKGYQGLKRVGDYLSAKGINPMGKSSQQIQLEDAFIDYSTIDPTVKNKANIIEAQERQFEGDRPLTVFEETGGKMGAGYQNVLLDTASQEARLSNIPTFYQKEREKYINQLKKNLLGEGGFEASDRATFNSLQSTLRDTRKRLDNEVDVASKDLRNTGKNIKLRTFDLKKQLSDKKNDLSKIGIEEGKKLYANINNIIDRYAPEGQIKATNLIDMQKSINNLKGKFAETKEAQSEVAGILSDVVDPIFKDIYDKNRIMASVDDKTSQEFFNKLDNYNQKALDRRKFLDSRPVKKFGSKEYRQDKDTLTPKTLTQFIFKDAENYKATKEMLADQPELMAKIDNGVRAEIFKNIYNSEAKEFNYEVLKKNLNSPEFLDIAKEIGGDKFVQNLYDTALIQYAYDQTAKVAGKGLLPSQKVGQNLTRYLVHPLAGRIGLSSAILSSARKTLGLGKVTDEQIYKFMKSENGQKVIKDVMNSPLNTPEGYNAYIQVVRELGKAGYSDIQLMTAPAFFAGVGEIISTTLDAVTPNMINNVNVTE